MNGMLIYLVQSLGAVLLAIILGHFVGMAARNARQERTTRR